MTGILAGCMPSGSTIAVCGALSGSESTVNPGELIFRGQSVSGYWVSREFQDRSPLGLLHIWRFLRSARRHVTTDLQSKAQAHVPLEDIATSLPKLLQSTSKGIIYIRPVG